MSGGRHYGPANPRVTTRSGGGFDVVDIDGEVLATCDTHSAAWKWIDRNTGALAADTNRNLRIRNSDRFR